MIIWATDGSSGAEQALPFAKDLAQAPGAQLVVVHVDEFTVGRGGGYPVNLNEEQVLAAVQKQVEALRQAGLDVTLQRANVTAGGERGYGPIAGWQARLNAPLIYGENRYGKVSSEFRPDGVGHTVSGPRRDRGQLRCG